MDGKIDRWMDGWMDRMNISFHFRDKKMRPRFNNLLKTSWLLEGKTGFCLTPKILLCIILLLYYCHLYPTLPVSILPQS